MQCFVTITEREGKGKFLPKKTVLRNYLHDFPQRHLTLYTDKVFSKQNRARDRERERERERERGEKELRGVQECIGTCLRDFYGCFLIRYLSKDPDVDDSELKSFKCFRFGKRKIS